MEEYEHAKYFDHVELYENAENNYVILTSPYDPKLVVIDGEPYVVSHDEHLLSFGFTKVEPLYGHCTTTYLKIVQKRV